MSVEVFTEPAPTGRKFDKNKLRYDLLVPEVMELDAQIITFGALKYEPNNWQLLTDARNRYYAAAMRHLQAWRMGEITDSDSGCHHLAHARTNLMFLMWFDMQEQCQVEGKDSPN